MADNNNGLRINQAIDNFNVARDPDAPRMTQKTLGMKVFQGAYDDVRAGWYLAQWQKGLEMTKLKPEHVRIICRECSVDPNFLYGF